MELDVCSGLVLDVLACMFWLQVGGYRWLIVNGPSESYLMGAFCRNDRPRFCFPIRLAGTPLGTIGERQRRRGRHREKYTRCSGDRSIAKANWLDAGSLPIPRVSEAWNAGVRRRCRRVPFREAGWLRGTCQANAVLHRGSHRAHAIPRTREGLRSRARSKPLEADIIRCLA